MSHVVKCSYGLGNRVAAIANGLSVYGEIEFYWENNFECPVNHWDVFPNGVPGVVFTDKSDRSGVTKNHGWAFDKWTPWMDRIKYRLVFEAMRTTKMFSADEMIIGRFKRFNSLSPVKLVRYAKGPTTFVFCDSYRDVVSDHLYAKNIVPVMPSTQELRLDTDRDASDFPAFINDWTTIRHVRRVVTGGDEFSSLVYPAFAYGITVTQI